MGISKHVEAEVTELKTQKKGKKAVEAEEVAAEVEVDPAEAKKQRKAAKRAAAEAAAAAEEEAEVDPAEAKRQRKAAKKAAAEAAAAAEAEAEEEDPAEAKKKRKAAKKAAAEAAAAAEAEKEEEAEEAPKKKSKKSKAVEAEAEEAAEPEKAEEAPKKEAAKAPATEEAGDDEHLEVFVGGLPWETTEEALKKDFAECGEITKFKMPMNDEGKAKGIAFIEFADAAAVKKALAFDGTDYGGRTLKVNKSNEKPSKDSAKGKGKDGKGKDGKGKGKGNKEFEIFIGGLPWETTEEVLRKDFSECGEIVSLRLPLKEDGTPRGIAFCEYKDQESVDKALKFNETEYGGRTLSVRKSGDQAPAKGDKGKGKGKDGKGKGNPEFEVFVGGVPESATEASLKELFGDCGEIDRLRLPLNEESKPKGIAFITFKDKDSCDKAVKMTDTEVDGSSLRVKMSGEGKDGKGKGKDGKGKGKGKKGKSGMSAEKFAAKDGSMGTPAGKKQTFDDSDDE